MITAQQKYNKTEKGKVSRKRARERYNCSEKGRVKNKEYNKQHYLSYHEEVRKQQRGYQCTVEGYLRCKYGDMLRRCNDPEHKSYKYYGGRGIKICERWWKFSDFLKDMGECPDGLSLERVNNNGNYEPGNCKWATQKEQCNNNRRNVKLTYKGKTMNMVQWAEELGISRACIWARINRRMPDEMIFTSRKFKPYEARDMN
ncbi:hypothetical protein LCGC14_2020410 [marine sediment metagenome]|uniref:Uncharacterized protein n=1 Tax=marine sediment metagenome TaxID=412755 RepID=A0A0F9HUU3_9ZZZZ